MIQNDLKWISHIESVIKKASKRLYFLIMLKRADVSISGLQLSSFYVACIQSVLPYARQVFHFSLPEYLSNNLERIQKRAMGIIHGFEIFIYLFTS